MCQRAKKIASKMSVCAHVYETEEGTCTYTKTDQTRNSEGLGNKEVADAAADLLPAQERVYASVGSSLAHTAVPLVSLKLAERADMLFF